MTFEDKVYEIYEAYSTIFEDGFQLWTDLYHLFDVTHDLVTLIVEEYADESWETQVDMTVEVVMKFYKENKSKLPVWIRWVPFEILLPGIVKQVVEYVKSSYGLGEQEGQE